MSLDAVQRAIAGSIHVRVRVAVRRPICRSMARPAVQGLVFSEANCVPMNQRSAYLRSCTFTQRHQPRLPRTCRSTMPACDQPERMAACTPVHPAPAALSRSGRCFVLQRLIGYAATLFDGAPDSQPVHCLGGTPSLWHDTMGPPLPLFVEKIPYVLVC